MNLARFRSSVPKLEYIVFTRQSSRLAVLNQDEYTETPEYPPILDTSLEARKKREREALFEKIKNINTIEEKQIALNMPRYYGWKCVMLTDEKVPYNAMPLVQGYTRSHFILSKKLPEFYKETEQAADEVVKEVKTQIEDSIAIELEGIEHETAKDLDKEAMENHKAALIVKQINRIIVNNLTDKLPHILSSQVDCEPRHEAFWFVGGVDPPRRLVEWRKKFKWLGPQWHESINNSVQYIGHPLLTIRNKLPLKPLIPYTEAEKPEFKVPKFTSQAKAIGYTVADRHGTNIPGFWPGDIDEFGLLSFHGRGHMLGRSKSFGDDDNLEALHCQAIKSSFGWLLAQANYQGFTTYNDITYPLITQTVITNGQLFSLYSYQLNTIEMHNEKIDDNPKSNICFGTRPMELYECIEDGKVKGLNEEVLRMLIQFYMNAPEEREHELKPYLGKEEQVVADIEDDKRRCWLESIYKHLVSNRPRHNMLPETYMWERIYKIKFDTRSFERKRRPFELGKNPYQRRLDEHLPPYIPKVLRPYPKARKKFETTYYPKV